MSIMSFQRTRRKARRKSNASDGCEAWNRASPLGASREGSPRPHCSRERVWVRVHCLQRLPPVVAQQKKIETLTSIRKRVSDCVMCNPANQREPNIRLQATAGAEAIQRSGCYPSWL